MSSGVLGIRSLPSVRNINTFGQNCTSGDHRLLFNFEESKKYAIQLLEQLEALIVDDICDQKSSHKLIAEVCRYLKSKGCRLDEDNAFRQQLDLYFDLLRNILRKPKLSPFARTMILEVIELRACNWAPNEDIEEYYRRKMTEFEANDSLINGLNSELQKSQSFISIGSDSSKSSLKPNKSAKVSTQKTFLRDEVLIRNGDSGKVTAGAKERLVQITGPSEESIERAKELIETTIKRNASPVPFECPNRAFDPNFNSIQNTMEFNPNVGSVLESTPLKSEPIIEATIEPKIVHKFSVEINNDVIHLSTTNYELGLRAEQILKQLLSDSPLKSVEPKLQICEKRNSFSDSLPIDDSLLKGVLKSDSKIEVMQTLDSLSKGVPKDFVNRIQRSSSQGTVPIGRTSLRFMAKQMESDLHSKITYDRHFLMKCSELASSKDIPNLEVMAHIYKKTPEIIRKYQSSGENGNNWAPLHKSLSFTQTKASIEN